MLRYFVITDKNKLSHIARVQELASEISQRHFHYQKTDSKVVGSRASDQLLFSEDSDIAEGRFVAVSTHKIDGTYFKCAKVKKQAWFNRILSGFVRGKVHESKWVSNYLMYSVLDPNMTFEAGEGEVEINPDQFASGSLGEDHDFSK